jgi:peptidoglycan/LPS O-acetylase OafA/YrhL
LHARTWTQTASRESYPYFDWLRIVLALAVVVHHSGLIGGTYLGDFAVQVFFALSGWLIGGVLLQTGTKSLPRFYFNRSTRIWIPYFASVAALYVLAATHDKMSWHWFEFPIYDLTFTHYWFVHIPPDPAMAFGGAGTQYWSISIEEQFYLFAPFLIVLAGRFGRHPLTWTAILILCLAFEVNFAAISLGVLAAIIRHIYGDIHLRENWRTAMYVIWPISLVAIFIDYNMAAPFLALCIVPILALPGPRTHLGTTIGGISFPLYLNHWIGPVAASSIANRFHIGGLSRSTLAITIGIAAGVAAYFAIDRVVMRNRDRFFTRQNGSSLALIGFALSATGLLFGLYLNIWAR